MTRLSGPCRREGAGVAWWQATWGEERACRDGLGVGHLRLGHSLRLDLRHCPAELR